MRSRIAIIVTVAAAIVTMAALASAELHTITNGVLTVGIDTAEGSGISYLVDVNNPRVNLINTYDEGRYLQQSYYSGPLPYCAVWRGRRECATWSDQNWLWNPISSGDAGGNKAKVLDIRVTPGKELYIEAIPLQWAFTDAVPCNCTFMTWISFAPGAPRAIVVKNRLTMYRFDTNVYPPQNQEEPALYTVAALSNLYSYIGTEPWTNASLTKIATPTHGFPWARYTTSESWSAFVNGDKAPMYGVGVMHPGVTTFLGGLSGQPGSWSTKDPSTGYQAPLPLIFLPGRSTSDYCYAVAVGYLATIRQIFYGLRNSVNCTMQTIP